MKKEAAAHRSTENNFGIASVILGILSIVFASANGLILAVIAMIFASKQNKIYSNSWSRAGKILSIIGFVLSVIAIILSAIYLQGMADSLGGMYDLG